jgi:FMN phosphatase YigB (HAD superfamily)
VGIFATIRQSLSVDAAAMGMVGKLRERFQGRIQIYAVTNMAREDFAWVRSLPVDWDVFDQIFVSGDMGMRKPELRFYQQVLGQIGLQPDQVILIDGDTDNRLAAMSVGMQGVPSAVPTASQTIVNLIEGNAVRRAREFLRAQNKPFHSVTTTGVAINENFAQLLILELTGDTYVRFLSGHAVLCGLSLTTGYAEAW